MYQASVPVFVQMLGGLANVLDKAEAYASARKIDQSILLGTPVRRLATIAHGDGICTTHVTHVTATGPGPGNASTAGSVVQHGESNEIPESGGLLT